MEKRKNEQHLRNIYELNESNKRKSYIVDRIMQKEKKVARLK